MKYLLETASQPQIVFGITSPFLSIPFSDYVVFSHDLTFGLYLDTSSCPYILVFVYACTVSAYMDKEFYHTKWSHLSYNSFHSKLIL